MCKISSNLRCFTAATVCQLVCGWALSCWRIEYLSRWACSNYARCFCKVVTWLLELTILAILKRLCELHTCSPKRWSTSLFPMKWQLFSVIMMSVKNDCSHSSLKVKWQTTFRHQEFNHSMPLQQFLYGHSHFTVSLSACICTFQ